jgi:hypothetical protein
MKAVICNYATSDHNYNLWLSVILSAFSFLKIEFDADPKWYILKDNQDARKSSIEFFNRIPSSRLPALCKMMQLDIDIILKLANETNQEVKICLGSEKAECYHIGQEEKSACG